ncbi:MAG: ATP synthase F1 subunit gamma [Chloroflexota bacterium]|nr:ATP synthase F1 subunit gamma [Chloroflexota bacterium]
MSTAREIKRRIKSVKNIGQVTRAMEAVAASKMRKAQDRTLASREYAEKAREVLAFLASQPGAEGAHPLLQERATIRRVALILITPDRGLAGALISNILRRTMRFIEQNRDKEIELITVGRKGRNFMRRYGPNIAADFEQPGDNVGEADASAIGQVVMEAFLNGEYDAVYLAYARFANVMSQEPTVQQLLPLGMVEASGTPTLTAEYLIEPNPEVLLDTLLPSLVDMQIYQSLLEALASEHSARMVAMRNATDNAKELAEDLQLSYNKARQTAITSEILDIAGGAEALAQAE